MKYERYLIFLLLIIVIPINKTYANCQDELKEIEDIKDEFQITYEYVENSGYILTFYNPNSNKYNFDITTKSKDLKCDEENEYYKKCYYYQSGKHYTMISSKNETCKEVLDSIELNLPYNEFSKDPVCKGIEDFVLCKPTYDKEIDYETFLQRVEVYKKTLAEEEKKEENKIEEPIEEKTIYEKILDYLIENIFIIVTIIIAIILLIILTVSIIRNYRERWKLE